MRSDEAKTSAAVSTMVAPHSSYKPSGKPEPLPAVFCSVTVCPDRTNSSTPTGRIATRYSSFFVSFGTPIFIYSASLAQEVIFFASLYVAGIGNA